MMDAPDVEAREPVPCPECGEVHLECSEAILYGMDLFAVSEAERRLSSEGKEALRMIDHAADTLPGGAAEALELADKNVEHLPENEFRTILLFLARTTMIDSARSELYE